MGLGKLHRLSLLYTILITSPTRTLPHSKWTPSPWRRWAKVSSAGAHQAQRAGYAQGEPRSRQRREVRGLCQRRAAHGHRPASIKRRAAHSRRKRKLRRCHILIANRKGEVGPSECVTSMLVGPPCWNLLLTRYTSSVAFLVHGLAADFARGLMTAAHALQKLLYLFISITYIVKSVEFHKCLNLSKFTLETSPFGHYWKVQNETEQFRRQSFHNYAGYSGPWIENYFIKYFITKSPQYWSGAIPLFIQWTDIAVNSPDLLLKLESK